MCPVEHQTWTKGFQALTPDFRLPWNLLLILCLFHFLFLFLPRRKLHVELEPAFQPADLAALQTYCRNHSRSGGCRAHLAVGGCGLLPCAHRWELNSELQGQGTKCHHEVGEEQCNCNQPKQTLICWKRSGPRMTSSATRFHHSRSTISTRTGAGLGATPASSAFPPWGWRACSK